MLTLEINLLRYHTESLDFQQSANYSEALIEEEQLLNDADHDEESSPNASFSPSASHKFKLEHR